MFRSKKDVDRHVQNIFSKLRNENEKNLRCYNVAKLYYQVGDYESARRYVSSYLEVRDNSASAHKLLGQANEALGQKEVAFNEYKISLELEGRQDDLVLKVCELLVDTNMGMDANKTRYWAERADKQFPHHPTVFQLKEKLLTLERPNNNSEDLEALIASELTARPTDVQLRVKLLRHYMSKHKLDIAYEHAINVEATFSHRNSIAWYQMLCELLTKCKEIKYSDWSFWILYISALERYAALCMKEQGNEIKKSVPEATQAVFNFDQNLNEIKLKNFSEYYSVFTEHVLTHMLGQLHFHLACLLLRKTKREQGSWSEAGRLCAPLLLTALHVTPMDPTATWTIHVKDQFKNQIDLWYREGSYRCSQAGHVLQDYARDDTKKLMDRIDKFCTGQWRERIYQRIFVSRIHLDYTRNSYFCNCSVSNSPLRLCCQNELKHYDEVAELIWPDSLHHQVWLGIKNRNSQNKDGPQPHQYSHLFPELQFSVYNSNQAAPDSLSQLDIDAFLNAATLCSSVIVEEQQLNSFLSPEKLPTLPADLTTTLCTCNQEKWWSAAYKMYSKQKDVEENIGEIRQELQQGLEVIRCIGNHGLHPVLLVHLARIFQYRAKMLKEKDEENGDIPALEAFSELYWSTVVPLLERLQNNQTIRTLTSKLFNYQGKEMNNIELTNALEEGRLLLAQTFVRDKQYEQAIDALQVLKCPDASFQQGQIYKMFADEIVNSMPGESLTSEMRSQHVIMLSKARNCFYLTLDRLRSPGTNPKHPLNSELGTYITEIENELKRIDPDLGRNDLSRNDCDVISDESYSPAHSTVEQAVPNPPTLTALTASHILSTPQRTTNRTPKQTSTPCKPQHQDILELSKDRTEARPSPERLDAQIRQIMHTRDNEMQELTELMKGMMDQIKTLTYKMDNLAKEVTESRKENQKQQQRVQHANINPTIEDDFYAFGEDEYADLNYSNQTAAASSISGNIFTPAHRHPYSSLVYPSATAFQGYYQSGIPFSDPNVQATIPSLYPHNMYPMPVLYPNRSKVPDNLLQQNLFASRLPPQLPDLMPPTNASLQMSVQKINESTKSEIKDAPVNKVLPINVVITTSDTVPTTAPVVQPTLGVTIPPQYRLGTSSALMTTMITPTIMTMTAVTTMATMTMTAGSSYTAPHCYQISMPSEATIPTTVNLPPLPATLTTTSVNIATSDMYQVPNNNNQNIHLTESPHTSTEIYDTEHDPIPDFVPVIPLPAEVKVTTGEEDEITLYCARAKLFRFVDKEWKERGIGYVKLLQNAEGKVRLLMRRDQVLKICANHMLTPEMELTAMMNNNKAWCWVANDFADEEVKLEKLCIRFKTVEEALSFKECFNNAKLSLTSSMNRLSEMSKVVSKSSGIDASKIEKSNQQVNTTATTDVIPNISRTSATMTLGGFSFTSQPIIQNITDVATANELKKPEESVRASPFRGFSFTKSTDKSSEIAIGIITTTNTSASSTSFTFATTTAPVKTSQFDSINQITVSTASVLTSRASNLDNNSSSQTILRRPRLPPPGATKTEVSDSIESKLYLQTETEQSLFDGKVNLLRQNNDNKQWENKAAGLMKLLLDIKSRKLRFLIVDEGNTKILYGHSIPLNTKFIFKSDTAIVNWIVSEEDKERKTSKLLYSADFQTMEMASQFNNVVSIYQQKLNEGCSASEIMTELEKKTPLLSSNKNKDQNAATNKHQLPLSELFKPPTGSWECNSCYTRNKATDLNCIACEAPSSLVVSNKSTSMNVSKNADSNKPLLSELFKPSVGSWTCSACYVINPATNVYCIACNIPKDLQSSKPQINTFEVNSSVSSTTPLTTFTFGIPNDTAKEAGTGFVFRLPKPEEKRIGDNASLSALIKSGETDTKFIFGVPVKPNTLVNPENSPFTFGSPAKIDFHFTAKSPTKSLGEAGENSEEEVVESDDIHFSPIIPLPEKIEVKTGEENEEVFYSHRAKLFRFDATVKEWKERGLGDIKLLCHKETGKLRLIMRRDHVLKLCLNHLLSTSLEFTPKDEKTWLWNAADYSEGEIEYMQFACRFKTSEIAEGFKKAIDDARNSIKSFGNEIIKNEPKTKAQTVPTQEIEILYETKVTLEEKTAALSLQLPENFYAYKQKKDCPGCRGCREPGMILYADNVLQESRLITTTKSDSTSKLSSTVITSTSANGFRITEPSSVAVKNGSLFAVWSTTISKPPTSTSSIFDGSTMSFGTADLKLFNEKKSTTFSFGMHPQFNANETIEKSLSNEQSASLLENIEICSSSNANTPHTMNSNIVGTGKSVFGNITPTASTFNTATFSFSPEKGIFGNISNSSFLNTSSSDSNQGNNLSLTSTLNSSKTTAVLPTNIPNTSSSILNIPAATDPLMITIQQNSKINDTTTSTIAFPISNQSNNSLFVMTSTPSYFSKTTFGNSTSVFGNFTTTTTSTVANTFNSKALETIQEDNNAFFPTTNMTFSALAAQATQREAFKVDPNFSFAGAGSSVFGSKSVVSSLNSSSRVQNKLISDSIQKDDNEDDGEADNEQEHDPHFEPIIPLPDVIEVRTGEEDEEKVFCQRAKLYRYDNTTKEWKERGVGDMKILYHALHGSYRLLLRRDQVYKVVCNFLLTSDVEFHPLSTSKQAWMWAGMNHAEQDPCIEQLAIKFKSVDLACQFKGHIDKIQQVLREKENQGNTCINETNKTEYDRDNIDEDEEDDEEEEDEEEDNDNENEDDNEDYQEVLPIVEKRATVYFKLPNETQWQPVGLGNLVIHYDSEIYAERIVLKVDGSEEYASNTIISMETVMKVEGKECIWTAIDYALNPPRRRVLKAVFSSIQAAHEMHTFFEEGLDSAKQAGVVEYDE